MNLRVSFDNWHALQNQFQVSSMTMVALPPTLPVTDVPGMPGAGLRAVLRSRYRSPLVVMADARFK